MSRQLRFEVEILCRWQDLNRASDEEIAGILRSFEESGDAMRTLNHRGDVVWKATPQLLEELAAAEREVDDEWKNMD